jgi:hypothetical protein
MLKPMDMRAALTLLRQRCGWQEAYRLAIGTPAQWEVIRAAYAAEMPAIMTVSQRYLRGRIDPYFVAWDFTPIEEIAWQTIRYLGTPLYPQVPADRFFLDFANPYYKIGIELDGADYHDPQKDAARDCLLMAQGWRIFRIMGSETHTPYELPDTWEEEPYDQQTIQAIHHWLFRTCDGVLTALDRVYFRHNPSLWPHYDLMLQSLDGHRYARFPLITQGAFPCDDLMV